MVKRQGVEQAVAAALFAATCLPAGAQDQPLAGALTWGGDMRLGYFTQRHDDSDGSSDGKDELASRIRMGLKWQPGDALAAQVRLAGRYSTEDNHPHFEFFDHIPDTDGLRAGDSTVDLLLLRWTPDPGWEVTLGRWQAAFELAGIPGGSLDRSDSPNIDISWTDGVHVVRHGDSGWDTHVILQYNTQDGATNVRLPPLDFTDSGSRVTYFAAMENIARAGALVQRTLDVSYLPQSLHPDGPGTARSEDYWAFVGRLAADWPLLPHGTHFLAGIEVGYAPNTPTRAASGLSGSGDAGGMAWQVSLNLLDIRRGHGVAYQYGRAQPGWLISPDFRSNEELHEVRYEWEISEARRLTARYRDRRDLVTPVGAVQSRRDQDLFLRYSIRF